MDISNLEKSYPQLLSYMAENQYSKQYIDSVKREILWILKHKTNEFHTYEDYYNLRCSCLQTEKYKPYKIIYGLIKHYDEDEYYPNGEKQHPLFEKSSFYFLEKEFRDFVDLYKKNEKPLSKSTISNRFSRLSCFLYYQQKLGKKTISEIDENSCISYIRGENGLCKFNASALISLKTALKIINTPSSIKINNWLPSIKSRRKNIQYLTVDEIKKIKKLLESDSPLSKRDRAIGLLLYFTGIRACDISNLKFENIDWRKERIEIIQQKTKQPLSIPLLVPVGNAIYDYATTERPKINSSYVFLSTTKPFRKLSYTAIATAITNNVYNSADIRMNATDRRGSHLFRHNFATSLLNSGISGAVITDVLGHKSPFSINSYLYADIKQLRECALSIEDFQR